MTPTQLAARAFQALPPPLRKTLYTVLGLAGLALAVCSGLGVDDLGPVTLAQALQVYAVLSAATGGVALANVGRQPRRQEMQADSLGGFDEDADLSSFQPVGLVTDVYGEAVA